MQAARQCAAWAAEATTYARQLGLSRFYRQGVSVAGATVVVIEEEGKAAREVQPADFRACPASRSARRGSWTPRRGSVGAAVALTPAAHRPMQRRSCPS